MLDGMLILTLCTLIFLTSCGKKEHRLVLDLESNPDSGFEWEVTQADELFEVEKEYIADESGDKQDGGIEHFTLTPIEAGFTNVTFTSRKTKDGKEEGAKYSYAIIVGDDLQIEVISSSGSLAGAELGSKSIPVPGIE